MSGEDMRDVHNNPLLDNDDRNWHDFEKKKDPVMDQVATLTFLVVARYSMYLACC